MDREKSMIRFGSRIVTGSVRRVICIFCYLPVESIVRVIHFIQIFTFSPLPTCNSIQIRIQVMISKVLVVGATGATGRHVVQMLLDKGYHVVVIVRSKDTMLNLVPDQDGRLHVHEAEILDVPEEELSLIVRDCSVIISCLGHNMSFSGIFGNPRRLVTDAVKILTTVMSPSSKFILMGSNGVDHPGGIDPPRSFRDRLALCMFRYLIPPHSDNEMAADYLFRKDKSFNWVIVRPTDLIDEETPSGDYDVFDISEGSLFGSSEVSRANVAHFIAELVTDENLFDKYNHQLPVIKHKSK